MKGLVYKLGTVLENKKESYKVKIVQIDKEFIEGNSEYKYVVANLNDTNDRNRYQIRESSLVKYYKVVE